MTAIIAKPCCMMCGRVMEEWPDNPERFLLEREWEPGIYPGGWQEPLERCTHEVSEEALEDARQAVERARTYLAYPTIQKTPIRRQQAEQTVVEAEERLASLETMKEAGIRTDLTTVQRKTFRGTDKMREPIHETVVQPVRRGREEVSLDEAVRRELNREIEAVEGFQSRKVVATKRHAPREMDIAEHSYILADGGNLKASSKAKLKSMQDSIRTTHVARCASCQSWPEGFDDDQERS